MPIYSYRCQSCNHADDEYRLMKDADAIGDMIECPQCHAPTYQRLVSLPHTDMIEFHTPIEMYSIAFNDDDEIAAFKRTCPDVDIATNPDDPMYGIPIARTRKQKLEALRHVGYVERN